MFLVQFLNTQAMRYDIRKVEVDRHDARPIHGVNFWYMVDRDIQTEERYLSRYAAIMKYLM